MAGFRAARRSYDARGNGARARSRTQGGRPGRRHLPLHRLDAVAADADGWPTSPASAAARSAGLQMIEETGSRRRAKIERMREFALVLLYNREQRYDDALRVLDSLRKAVPAQPSGRCSRRAPRRRGRNRPQQAEALLTEGMAMLANDKRAEDSRRGRALALQAWRGACHAAAARRRAGGPAGSRWRRARAGGCRDGRTSRLARLALQQGDRRAARRRAAGARRDAICGGRATIRYASQRPGS